MTNKADIDVKIECQPAPGVTPLCGAATTEEIEQPAEAVSPVSSV